MALATIHQYIPSRPVLIRDEPDIPDSIHRSTEERALRNIAMRVRYSQQAGRRNALPGLHLDLLRLERAAMQWLPQLTFDERMEFIAGAAKLRNVSPRQIEALLDQAGSIMMLRDLSGLDTAIYDLTEQRTKQLYGNALRGQVGKRWGPVKGRPAAQLAVAV